MKKKSMTEWLMEFSSRVDDTKTKTIKECRPHEQVIYRTRFTTYSLN